MKRSIAIAVVFLITQATGLTLATQPAGALCTLYDEFGYSVDTGWGREEPYGSPQCGPDGYAYPYGNNGHYRGIVKDILTDGSCVSVRYSDGSYYRIQATSCDAAGYIHSFYDQTGNYSAYARLERNQGVSGWYYSNGY